MANNWEDTVRGKMNELESIASWASIVGFGQVRDHCRLAKGELLRELERVRLMIRVSNEAD